MLFYFFGFIGICPPAFITNIFIKQTTRFKRKKSENTERQKKVAIIHGKLTTVLFYFLRFIVAFKAWTIATMVFSTKKETALYRGKGKTSQN
jgi:hypothetical protein